MSETERELRERVARLQARFSSYDVGDRPMSPPVRLIREVCEAEAALSAFLYEKNYKAPPRSSITREQIAEARAALENATKRPWVVTSRGTVAAAQSAMTLEQREANARAAVLAVNLLEAALDRIEELEREK